MTLDDLTKEDLIKVVANMHDTIQDWNNGWGLPKKDATILIKIGRLCTDRCCKNQDWKLPNLEKE